MPPTRHLFLMTPPSITERKRWEMRGRRGKKEPSFTSDAKNFLLSPQIRETPVFLPQPASTRVGEHPLLPPKSSGGPPQIPLFSLGASRF